MPRRNPWLAGLAVTLFAIAGCGSDPDPVDDPADRTSAATGSPSTPSGAATTSTKNQVAITFEGDEVTPNGEWVEVDLDQPVTLVITADAPGEIHVHATPEQEFGYEAGTSMHTLTFEHPGVIEVESHDLEKIIVQLEVR